MVSAVTKQASMSTSEQKTQVTPFLHDIIIHFFLLDPSSSKLFLSLQ